VTVLPYGCEEISVATCGAWFKQGSLLHEKYV